MREIDQFALSSISRKLASIDHGKVSVCIVAKNDEERLPDCINSALRFADEIIVVDRGSKDQTVEVARKLGAKVFFLPLNSDFARIRNFALDLALNNWVLVLEPGERLRVRDIRKEQILLGGTDIWLCPVGNPAELLSEILKPQLQPRLFKRSAVQGYKGESYVQLEYSSEAKIMVSEQLCIEFEASTIPVFKTAEIFF